MAKVVMSPESEKDLVTIGDYLLGDIQEEFKCESTRR
jgi:hypothetical protein